MAAQKGSLMQLHHSPTSPFVRKVVVTALLTKTFDGIQMVPASVTPLKPSADVQRVNPLGKIPTLVLDDGTALYDSAVICEYLDSIGKGAMLVPAAGAERWDVLRLNALADGLLDAAFALRLELMRPDDKQYEPWISAQRIKVNNALKALDAEAGKSLKKLSLGSVATACALGWLDFRLPDLGWRADHAQLASWYEAFSEEWFMQQTRPPA
jgi:glutathione S-transferase